MRPNQRVNLIVATQPKHATRYLSDAMACTGYRDALIKYALAPCAIPPRGRKCAEARVATLLYSTGSDQDVIGRIIDAFPARAVGGHHPTARSDNRTEAIETLLSMASLATQPTSIIDYGCGDGAITRALGDRWPDATLLGVDVAAESPSAFDALPLIPAIAYANDISAVESASVDLVTAFVSLHHMHGKRDIGTRRTPLDSVLDEIARVVRPGMHLIIREHDLEAGPRTASHYAFLQLVHILYDMRDGRLNMDQLVDETLYRSRAAWDDIICAHGFELITHITPPYKNNPQAIYHAIYRRI